MKATGRFFVVLGVIASLVGATKAMAEGPCDTNAWEQCSRTEAVVEDHIANHPTAVIAEHEHNTHTHVAPEKLNWYIFGAVGVARNEYTYTQTIVEDEYDYYAQSSTYGKNKKRYRPRSRTVENNSDETELAFRAGVGIDELLNVGPIRIGTEFAYANLGDIGDGEVDLLDLTATARLTMFSDVDLVVRAGAAYWDAIDDGLDGTAAIGLTKGLGDKLRLGAEVSRYWNVENHDSDVGWLRIDRLF